MKVPVAEPLGMVMFAGTLAINDMLLLRVMDTPPAGAGPLNVTVPVDGLPPATVVGFSVTELKATAGVIARDAVLLTLLYLAVIVAVLDELTTLVVTAKVAVEVPAATVMLAGTTALVLLLERVTVVPPVGASPVKVTVPVDGLPPITGVGLSDTELKATVGVIVRDAVLLTP